MTRNVNAINENALRMRNSLLVLLAQADTHCSTNTIEPASETTISKVNWLTRLFDTSQPVISLGPCGFELNGTVISNGILSLCYGLISWGQYSLRVTPPVAVPRWVAAHLRLRKTYQCSSLL